MSILIKQGIKYYIINTVVTNNLSLKKRIPCIQYGYLETCRKLATCESCIFLIVSRRPI